jgi:3-oxoacyl-[acyl-carrier protein] reductase
MAQQGSTLGRCLVIGAAGGIGRRLCHRLAGGGRDLLLAGRDAGRLGDLASELREHGCDIRTAEVDATDFGAVEKLMGSADDLTGAVNLAGSILLKPAHLTSAEEFQTTIDRNLRTAFALVRAAGLTLRKRGGSVVLVSTCAATVGLANHEAIAAAKAGVEGLARAAAASYATSGLRINAVAPGLVNTPLAERITGNDAALKASIAMHPLGRIGEPDEVAAAIEFLLGPDAGWITGQVLGVDGGLARLRTK